MREGLKRRGVTRTFVPRSREYNLVDGGAVPRRYEDARPDVVIHLAAIVGGIGANRQNPGKFFYDNLMMGAQVLEEGRRRGVSKFVAVGTVFRASCYQIAELKPAPEVSTVAETMSRAVARISHRQLKHGANEGLHAATSTRARRLLQVCSRH